MSLRVTVTMLTTEQGARYRALGYKSGVVYVYYHAAGGGPLDPADYWLVSTVAREAAPPWLKRVIQNHPVQCVFAGAGEKVVDVDLRSALLVEA